MQIVPLLTDAKAINRAETQMDKIRSELVKMVLWFMLISHNIKNHWQVKWITLIISLQWHLSEHLQNGTSSRDVSLQDLPFWLLPTKSGAKKDNLTPVHHWKWLQWACECLNWTLEKWKKVTWSDKSHFLLDQVDGQVHVCCLHGKMLAAGCTMGRRQASGCVCNVLLRNLGSCIHVDVTLTCTPYLMIVADHIDLFMAIMFVPWWQWIMHVPHCKKYSGMFWGTWQSWSCFFGLHISRSHFDWASIGSAGPTNPIPPHNL